MKIVKQSVTLSRLPRSWPWQLPMSTACAQQNTAPQAQQPASHGHPNGPAPQLSQLLVRAQRAAVTSGRGPRPRPGSGPTRR